MSHIQVDLFKNSHQPFCEMLKASNIDFSDRSPLPGVMMAAASTIEIAAGIGAVLGPVATVLIAWIRSKSSRKVVITTKKNEVVHLIQGMSVEEVEKILETTKMLAVVDTDTKSKS